MPRSPRKGKHGKTWSQLETLNEVLSAAPHRPQGQEPYAWSLSLGLTVLALGALRASRPRTHPNLFPLPAQLAFQHLCALRQLVMNFPARDSEDP